MNAGGESANGSQQLDVVIPASKGTDEVGKRIVKSRPTGLGQKDSLKPCVPLRLRWDDDDITHPLPDKQIVQIEYLLCSQWVLFRWFQPSLPLPVPEADSSPVPPVVSPKWSPVKPGSGIEKLQKSLAFNPAMLRPGAAPPKKEVAPTAASFDEPATVTTLESANKVQFS